jgi:streptogramin lyase
MKASHPFQGGTRRIPIRRTVAALVGLLLAGLTGVGPAAATTVPVSTPFGAVSTEVAGVGWAGASIAVDESGRTWYTTNANGGGAAHRVNADGSVTSWSDPSILWPLSLTSGPDGSMWWVDEGSDSISTISANGTLSTFTGGGINHPMHIVPGPDGNLWFTNWAHDNVIGSTAVAGIGRITPTGTITLFTDPKIVAPLGITVGADGALWFTDQGGTPTIGRMTIDGSLSTFSDPRMKTPRYITAGSDGALWYDNVGDNSIGRITTSGTVTRIDVGAVSGLGSVDGLTTGPDGNVWFGVESYGVGRVTPDGTVTGMEIPGIKGVSPPPIGVLVASSPSGSLLLSGGGDMVRLTLGSAPGAPTAVTALRSAGSSALVRWQAPATDGGFPVTGYTVTASPGGQSCQWSSGPLQCTVSGLNPGGSYTFAAQATNAVGPGPVSSSSASLTAGWSSGVPFGAIDRASGIGGAIQVSGWAIDPDTGSVDVTFAVDGASPSLLVPAADARPDLDAAMGFGPDHGYHATIAAAAGSHTVCVKALDPQPYQLAGVLGCRTVTVRTGSPVGSLDRAVGGPGAIRVGGWALDPDTAGSISVAVYVDGKGVAWYPASTVRADIAAAFPGYGAAHGYDVTFSAGAGSHSVCVYGINIGPGANVALGCRSVTVPGGDPVGSLDGAARSGSQLTVSGWALDPDTAASIPVAVYVEGRGIGWFTAGGTRGDIAAAYPGYGAAHGYSVTTPVLATDHHVCVYAINQGTGTTNTVLGCRTF